MLAPGIFLLSVGSIIAGMRSLLGAKPVIVRGAWVAFWVTLIISGGPETLLILRWIKQDPGGSSASSFAAFLVLPICYLILRTSMPGYSIFFLYGDPLNVAVESSLRLLGVAFEERPFEFRLLTADPPVDLTVETWFGSGKLAVARRRERETLRTVLVEVRAYYDSRSPARSTKAGFIYVGLGVLVLLIGILVITIG